MTKKKHTAIQKKENSVSKGAREVFSQASLSPQVLASLTLEQLIPIINFSGGKRWEPSHFDILAALTEQLSDLRKGDISRLEAILLSQAHTLDRLFNNELMHALRSGNMDVLKSRMDLALKAQRQCRSTIETLAFIKNPQPYVRQQNVAVNQQINNGANLPSDTTRARGKKQKHENGLLEMLPVPD